MTPEQRRDKAIDDARAAYVRESSAVDMRDIPTGIIVMGRIMADFNAELFGINAAYESEIRSLRK